MRYGFTVVSSIRSVLLLFCYCYSFTVVSSIRSVLLLLWFHGCYSFTVASSIRRVLYRPASQTICRIVKQMSSGGICNVYVYFLRLFFYVYLIFSVYGVTWAFLGMGQDKEISQSDQGIFRFL